ncbi:hypothetical protein H5410_045224 [Solanum commersonii]|uniref:Uncharacterized protein n=1 Tax=Solanum commersonii TaxID=4109 RepID=A0A9J5XC20_SOLCO|nr:hypothetical protein H5410_045224 [Solanum commersonii]
MEEKENGEKKLEELKKEKETLLNERKSIDNIITNQILVTNVEDLVTIPKIIESGTKYSSKEESTTSEDLKAPQQEDYLTSEDECSPCQQGMVCEKDEEDNLYKIDEQFKELSLNVIDNDRIIELLQNIKDPKIRAQIIDKISDSREKDHISKKDHIPREIPTKEGSYTMAEVKNLL